MQANRNAFVVSNKYHDDTSQTTSYLGHIIHGFYEKPGWFLASLQLFSIVYLTGGMYFLLLLFENISPSTQKQFLPELLFYFLVFYGIGYLSSRILGIRQADNVLFYSALPIHIVNFFQIPLTKILLWLPLKWMKSSKVQSNDQFLLQHMGIRRLNEKGLQAPVVFSQQNIKESDMKLFRNTLEFSSIRVRDCIVPRTEIIAVEQTCSLPELTATFSSSGKTRLIIYKDDLDHIVGYIHSSEMFRQKAGSDWKKSVSEIPVVPESMSAQKMMHIFLEQKKPLAVVVDEFGGTTGIISLEDLVEEIFGDIEDEHDSTNYTARKLSDDEYLLSARLEIEKINETFNLDLPVSDEYITLGGFILFHNEAIPKENQDVSIGKFQFHIVKASRSQIHLIKLKVLFSEKK